MRFLLVDDHAIVREGLAHLLHRSIPGVDVVEAASAREAMAQISKGAWDLVFLDIDLPDRSGLDLLHDLKAIAPDTPMLVVSGMVEEQFGERALEAGADGFVGKATSPEEILTAVRRVRAGKKYISPDLGVRLIERRLRPDQKAAHETLSAREFEVLRLLGDGRTVSEIAASLNLSVKTVSTYRTRVLEKLGLATTAEIIRYALRHGLEK